MGPVGKVLIRKSSCMMLQKNPCHRKKKGQKTLNENSKKKTCWPETLWVPSNVVPGAGHEVFSNLFHLYETSIKIGRSTIQLLAISPKRPWVSSGEQKGEEECGSRRFFQWLCYISFWVMSNAKLLWILVVGLRITSDDAVLIQVGKFCHHAFSVLN